MAGKIAFVGNSNVLRLDRLQFDGSTTYINDADVTCTLVDSLDGNITGSTWPQSLTYIDGSDGRYELELLHSLDIEKGKKYTAKITAKKQVSQAYWEFTFFGKVRNS